MLRLTSSKDYTRLRQSTTKVIGKYFIIVYLLDNDIKENQAGITVSRKIGNAVVRNKIKRRVKAFLHHFNLAVNNRPFISNIVALPSVVEASMLLLSSDLERAFHKVQKSIL